MSEKACVFGRGLFGVLDDPPRTGPLSSGPAVLLWNVGMNHRVGPNRVYVELARRLSSKGACVLRFDLSGFGDSEPRSGGGSDMERALADLRDAMQFVQQRTGRNEFIAVGYCSSVDSAHRLTLADPRVVGCVYVEGYAFRNYGFYLRYYRRLFNRRRWERYARTKLVKYLGLTTELLETRDPVFVRDLPTREQFQADVAKLVERKARLFFVYMGGDTDYGYHDQFFDMYGGEKLRDKVDVVFFGQADHILYRVSDRRQVIESIGQWAERTFGDPTVRSPGVGQAGRSPAD